MESDLVRFGEKICSREYIKMANNAEMDLASLE
jgi:hypothetical protein